MNTCRSTLAALALLGLAGLPTMLSAEDAGKTAEPTGMDKVMMHKAARADCLASLAAQVKGLSISERSCVANAVLQDSRAGGFVEALVKGAVLEEPVYAGDCCLV